MNVFRCVHERKMRGYFQYLDAFMNVFRSVHERKMRGYFQYLDAFMNVFFLISFMYGFCHFPYMNGRPFLPYMNGFLPFMNAKTFMYVHERTGTYMNDFVHERLFFVHERLFLVHERILSFMNEKNRS